MIIYNITIKIEPAIRQEWLEWIKVPVARMMGSGLFLDYRMCRLLQQDETDGITYTLQFSLQTLDDYHRYERDYAPVLQEEYSRFYPGQYVCFRTLMEVL